MKQKQQYSRADAGYRVALKRIIRAAIGHVDNETRSIFLEIAVKRIAITSPAIVARGMESWFEQAAKAWVRGNNSGNTNVMEACKIDCDRLRERAERVLTLWDVSVDYPGLYPSFSYKGANYHDCLSLLQAIARTEVT